MGPPVVSRRWVLGQLVGSPCRCHRQALVVPENCPPIIASLTRCIEGRRGQQLRHEQKQAQARVDAARAGQASAAEVRTAALAAARRQALIETQ